MGSSLKSGLFAIALTSLVGTAAVVGCSANGTTGIADTTDPTTPPPVDEGNHLPAAIDSGPDPIPDAGKDASKKDSGPKPDAGIDAGPPPPVEGTACPTLNAKASKTCGACGTAETLCLDDGTGKGKWTAYGQCTNELTNGCIPGSVTTEDCGNCGKQTKTCNQYCSFTVSTCAGEPVNSCKPGTLEYSGAGCPVPSTYRNRTCAAACTWGGYSATCQTPVNELLLNIAGAVGATTSKTITFTAAHVLPRLSAFGTCPLASAPSPGDYPYQYIEIHNPSATKAAKVTVYSSFAPGSAVVIDTIMAVYATAIQPMDDNARKQCRDGVNDQSPDISLTGNVDFSLLSGVAIPAGGSVLVYLATYYQYSAGGANVTTGDLSINAKVETLN